MSSADDIWKQSVNIYQTWGLSDNPFTESGMDIQEQTLKNIFTGRQAELRQVFPMFQGRGRKRVMVYGWYGIGKTAFVREVLATIERNTSKTLTAYISLQPNMDLSTAALVALAREMKKDQWAQHQLNLLGIVPHKPVVNKETEISAGLAGTGAKTTESTSPIQKPAYPGLSFETLLERAYEQYEQIIIAIDDLDKLDPAEVRQQLRDAQGLLKGRAWFMVTGHPSGIKNDIMTQELGLFDLILELHPMDQDTTYEMLVNYLNSVKQAPRTVDEPQAVFPFTVEAAKLLCEQSEGIPRLLNRMGSYVLLKASELNAQLITEEIVEQGIRQATSQIKGQMGLSTNEIYLLEMVLEKGLISDENINLTELENMGAQTFREILPMLEKLMQQDLLKRLPSGRAIEYAPSALLKIEKEQKESD